VTLSDDDGLIIVR